MEVSRETSKTKHVYLRHPESADLDALSELYKSSQEHLMGFAISNFDSGSFMRMLDDAAKETNRYFLICRKQDDAVVGTINLSQIFRKAFQNAYLGYMLGAEFTGNGYMTEAVSLILIFAFQELKLHRVEANVQPVNLPSIAVLKRNGFTREGFSRRYLKIAGRWRDHERWAIIKEDWQEINDLDRS